MLPIVSTSFTAQPVIVVEAGNPRILVTEQGCIPQQVSPQQAIDIGEKLFLSSGFYDGQT